MIQEKKDIDLPSALAYLYKPVLPLLKKIHIRREGEREPNPDDILLPEGFVAEVVATGLNAPVHCCFDDRGNCYISESGHKIDSPPRIVKLNLQTGERTVLWEASGNQWKKTGALTGACWHEGSLYFTNTDTLCRLGPDGAFEELIADLPGSGDHQVNYPVVGPDDKLYFGVGTATNCGVVGGDNFAFEWLPKYPEFHDVPARDLVLAGRNYEYRNVLGDEREKVLSGAYVPFGTPTQPGQVVPGNVKCGGSVLCCNLDGSDLEVVAWGLRNPYGTAFHPDGRLYVTEHGMDDRGGRYVVNDPDDFYQIEHGRWYGWPDFASGIRLDNPFWGEAGQGREPVLAEFPDPNPPKPVVSFQPHAAANGVDFCRSGAFGFEGDAFVALYGDLAPITTARMTTPAGFKVVRVDTKSRRIVDFAVNKYTGPASQLPHEGFERPSHCAFGPDDALYVIDYGKIKIAPEAGGIRMPLGTGMVWRIRRTAAPRGEAPPPSKSVPVYLGQLGAIVGGAAALVGAAVWLGRRRGNGRKGS